jgi:hypothetical protein
VVAFCSAMTPVCEMRVIQVGEVDSRAGWLSTGSGLRVSGGSGFWCVGSSGVYRSGGREDQGTGSGAEVTVLLLHVGGSLMGVLASRHEHPHGAPSP